MSAKRLIDGEAIWRSNKLRRVQPPSYRAHYPWLLPLANDVGTFECDPAAIWAAAYAVNCPETTVDEVVKILDEFERVKLLFRWQDEGKTWAFWVGIDRPGLLPGPTHRYSKAPTPDRVKLAEFLGIAPPPLDAARQPDTAAESRTGTGNGLGTGNGSGTGPGTGADKPVLPVTTKDKTINDLENLLPVTSKPVDQLPASQSAVPYHKDLAAWLYRCTAAEKRKFYAVLHWGEHVSDYKGWKQADWKVLTIDMHNKMERQYDKFYSKLPLDKKPHNLNVPEKEFAAEALDD